jgi:hypothetical protein
MYHVAYTPSQDSEDETVLMTRPLTHDEAAGAVEALREFDSLTKAAETPARVFYLVHEDRVPKADKTTETTKTADPWAGQSQE